jgi:hypothetical protein
MGTVKLARMLIQYRHTTNKHALSYRNHRFPPETIRYRVWLHFRFSLTL